MDEKDRMRFAALARAGIVAREAVTYEGRALWPLEKLGTAMVGGAIAVVAVMVLLKVVLG